MNSVEQLRTQILLQEPTKEQEHAIFAEELEYILRAAPGSGKTWTSCRRFIWRGANWPYPAGGLALLSFTNNAVREFQRATKEIGRRELLHDPNYVGTFDAFVERFILTPFGHLLTKNGTRPKLITAPRPGDRKNKKLQAWAELKNNKVPVPAWEIAPVVRDRKVHFEAAKYNTVLSGGQRVVENLIEQGYYSHSQRVYWAFELIRRRPRIGEVLAKRFPEIIVDEAQDTNAWLVVFLNMMRTRGVRVTLIGDPDQCIFEFSMADAGSLAALKKRWKIAEKPLSKSFRCNDAIASAVKVVGGNKALRGCGESQNRHCRPFVVRDSSATFSESVRKFERMLAKDAGLTKEESAIVCRGHQQLEAIRGAANYSKLKGITKKLALASFFRDIRRDFNRAYELVEESLRGIIGDDGLWNVIDERVECDEALQARLAIWRFIKRSDGLPEVRLGGEQWIAQLKNRVQELLSELGIEDIPKLGQQIKKTGLSEDLVQLPLFESETLFPAIRHDTIHKVKGESIDAVLLVGSNKFWNSVVGSISQNANSEDRRLAYVGMTRARHLLVVSLPEKHFDKHSEQWTNWGFDILE